MVIRFRSRKPALSDAEKLKQAERALAIAFLQRALEVDETRGSRKC